MLQAKVGIRQDHRRAGSEPAFTRTELLAFDQVCARPAPARPAAVQGRRPKAASCQVVPGWRWTQARSGLPQHTRRAELLAAERETSSADDDES